MKVNILYISPLMKYQEARLHVVWLGLTQLGSHRWTLVLSVCGQDSVSWALWDQLSLWVESEGEWLWYETPLTFLWVVFSLRGPGQGTRADQPALCIQGPGQGDRVSLSSHKLHHPWLQGNKLNLRAWAITRFISGPNLWSWRVYF